MGLRDKILNCQDIPEEALHISEWNCKVNVRGLTGEERADLIQNNMLPNGKPNLKNMYPMITILCVRDPDTKETIFSLPDRDAINRKSGAVLERIAMVAMRLSGLTPESQAELEKNFAIPNRSDASISR